jgi:hypothetical protein
MRAVPGSRVRRCIGSLPVRAVSDMAGLSRAPRGRAVLAATGSQVSRRPGVSAPGGRRGRLTVPARAASQRPGVFGRVGAGGWVIAPAGPVSRRPDASASGGNDAGAVTAPAVGVSRPSGAFRTAGDRGSVTVETAVAFPALVLLLAIAVWGVSVAAAQVACVDAARAAARAAARGEPLPEVRAAAGRAAPRGASVWIRHDARFTRVVVRATVAPPVRTLFPSLRLRAQAVAATEPEGGGRTLPAPAATDP